MLDNIFKNSKSILCLNGNLPNKSFFPADKIIVATDGAGDQLLNMKIQPNVIIGDLDSAKNDVYQDIEVIHIPDQNQSDFQKAISYLAANKLLPTIVYGASGGFLDHILHNINVILENDCIFYSPPLIGCVIRPNSISKFTLKPNSKLSLLGIPNARVKTSGLKWELDNEMLEFPGANSCFNRTLTEEISIEVTEGKLLMIIYNEDIQDRGII